jgi:hypothetical protein
MTRLVAGADAGEASDDEVLEWVSERYYQRPYGLGKVSAGDIARSRQLEPGVRLLTPAYGHASRDRGDDRGAYDMASPEIDVTG